MPAPPDASRRPLLLALDTSTSQAGVALYDGTLLAELIWPAGRHGSRTVLPEVARLLELAGRAVAAVTAVGVALGPGSFSALRVGLSAAKGLAYALGCPLLGIPTLDVVSYPYRSARQTVWAVLDAGRDRLVAAAYAQVGPAWQAANQPVHGSVAEVVEQVKGPALVCGELSDRAVALLAGRARVTVVPPALRPRRPGCLAELAWGRWQAGQADDPATLEPRYLHEQ